MSLDNILVSAQENSKLDHQSFTKEMINLKELVTINRTLLVLIKSGISFKRAFSILLDEPYPKSTKDILSRIEFRIHSGQSLPMALSLEPQLFDSLYIKIIEYAENTKKFPEVFARLVDFFESLEKIQARKNTALLTIIPVISSCFFIAILLIANLGLYFENLINLQGEVISSLDFLHQIIQSSFLFSLFTIFIAVLLIFLIYLATSVGNLKLKIDQFMIRSPLSGTLISTYEVTLFLKSLALLVSIETPLIVALKDSKKYLRNEELITRLEKIEAHFCEGSSLSKSLNDEKFLPRTLIQIILMGESTGNLYSAIQSAGCLSENSFNDEVTRLTIFLKRTLFFIIFFSIFSLLLIFF